MSLNSYPMLIIFCCIYFPQPVAPIAFTCQCIIFTNSLLGTQSHFILVVSALNLDCLSYSPQLFCVNSFTEYTKIHCDALLFTMLLLLTNNFAQ